ncbi:NAD-dependent DNA ligase LigA [Candidatus Pelagibacter communis]|uniref:NAD-dependent DNA ligase LigA n=1 Tax=Pelagibacter ubique TaxID=198252 RepID=UPI00094D6A92|nr:NAD-dependent DNA ligase LigA [Candidatus Pelagibacter ubique]
MSNSLLKQYKEKLKLLDKFNKHYYQNQKPIVSDKEYDELKSEILKIEKNYNFTNLKSPSVKVGYKPSKKFEKFRHRVKMLSLSNAFNEEDLINFQKKNINFLALDKNYEFEYSAEPKIDGISASLNYKNGKLIKGLSRGDGEEGEDITENLKTIKDIPLSISHSDFPDEIDIRGEVFIETNDFKKIEKDFANPRNAASGSLRQKNPKKTELIPLKFIAYTFGFNSNLKEKKQSDFIKNLDKWGFKISDLNKTIKGINNLVNYHSNIEKKRFTLNYDIDGIVYKVNDFSLQKRLGFMATAPRWAIAHKFSANYSVTKIINIDIQVGRTGALTPVAKVKPVNIGGVMVSNATLHNEDEINRKDIRIGDTVKIERAGDVIPHVISVDKKLRTSKSQKYIFPNNCPSCGSKTIKEYNSTTKKIDAVRRCSNEGFGCEKISIEKLKHFVSKDALNIEGLGKKVVEKFWDLKFIKFPDDIFNLNFKKISELDGWGPLSVENLKNSINKSKKLKLDKFIYSLGIRHIGQENAKLISEFLKDYSNFINLKDKHKIEELSNIDGIGETQINSLKAFFENKTNLMVTKSLGRILTFEKNVIKKNKGVFSNKILMFTGKLSNISRAEAKSIVENNGGKIVSNVSKKLDYLVIGEKPTSRKIKIANDLKIKILNQKDFEKISKLGQ